MSKKNICNHWLRGSCTYQNCRFLHVKMEERGKYDVPCKYYLRGYCKNGRDCKYRHNIEGGIEKKKYSNPRFKTVHCSFYLGGYCKKQEKCTFIHDPIKLREIRDQKRQQIQDMNDKKNGKVKENLLILNEQKEVDGAQTRVKAQMVSSAGSSENGPR